MKDLDLLAQRTVFLYKCGIKVGAMITDEQIRYVVWKAATLFQQKCGNEEVYLYQYSHKGTYGMWLVWGMDSEGNGPSHFDECLVMFKNKVGGQCSS